METSLNDMSETNELNEVNNTVEAELTGLTDHSDENTDKRFSEEVNLSGLKGLLNQTFHLEDKDLRTYSPLTLAYIGDGVYELVIRTILVKKATARSISFTEKPAAWSRQEPSLP